MPMRTTSLPPLRPYQVEAGRAILDSALNGKGLSFSVEIARQGGKNELSAQLELLLLAANLGRPLDAIKCAPTFRPQALISLRRLWSRIAAAGLDGVARREATYAIRLGRARQLFLSAEPGSNVVGHTAQLLLEVDEAQDVEVDKFDRDFRPMAAAANATTVYYGTAWDSSSLLERAKQTHLELERRDGIRRHFQYDWQAVAAHNPAYRRFVLAEQRRLGADHPLFLTQYCLRTVSGGGRLFGPTHLSLLQGAHPRLRGPISGEAYIAGLDPAGEAQQESPGPHDATVLTVARVVVPPPTAAVQEPRLEVVAHYQWTGERHDALLAQLTGLLKDVWRVRSLAIDSTGMGETLARLLTAALGERALRPVRFSTEAKSRLGYGLLAAVNGGRLKAYAADASPECLRFWQEMEAARVHYRPNRTMNFFVDEADGHDDYLMSLALVVAAAADARPRTARGRVRE